MPAFRENALLSRPNLIPQTSQTAVIKKFSEVTSDLSDKVPLLIFLKIRISHKASKLGRPPFHGNAFTNTRHPTESSIQPRRRSPPSANLSPCTIW